LQEVKAVFPKYSFPPFFALALVLLLTGCGSPSVETEDVAPLPDASATAPEEDQSADTTEEVTAAPDVQALSPLPPERQALEITTADGRTLEGYYYPAAVNPAPIVVLMHWAGGDMEDWREIAPWLQNRAAETGLMTTPHNALLRQEDGPWLDPSWFPPLPANISFGVLIFNFGGYGASEAGDSSAGDLAEDARAAVAAAAMLEGAAPHQIAALGASIGADGAVDGCYLYDLAADVGTCQGALSLSPGNYLTKEFTYSEAVEFLDQLEKPIWCLGSEGDYAYAICQNTQGNFYETIYFPMDFHGMFLIQPDYLPSHPPLGVDTLVIIQDFLEAVFDLVIN
jgi:dienelactone hydrolase